MKKRRIGLTTATIYGLEENVYYCEEKLFWAWDIRFKTLPCFTFKNMLLYMGKTEQEANVTKQRILTSLNKLKISENTKVPVIFDDDGVIAIGINNTDSWIDVRDKYQLKTFNMLNLNLDTSEFVLVCN